MHDTNRHNEKAIYSVTAQEKQNLAVSPRRNTPSVPSITERSVCNPKPPTADTEAMLNTVTATFFKILPEPKKPIKPTKLVINSILVAVFSIIHMPIFMSGQMLNYRKKA